MDVPKSFDHNTFDQVLVNPKPPPLSIVVRVEAYSSHLLTPLHLALGIWHPMLHDRDMKHTIFIQGT